MATTRTNWGERTLAQLLGSNARARVLACLLLPGARPMHVREITRECGLHYSAVQRELKLLEQAGLVEAEEVGRARRYHVVLRSPLTAPLRDLVRRALGAIPLLRKALDRDDIEFAFIYGSVVTGEDRPDSDIDVLVVGDMDDMELSRLLDGIASDTSSNLSPVIYTSTELRQSLQAQSSFLHSIIRLPKIMLKGDEDALRAVAEGRQDQTAPVEPARIETPVG